MIEQFEIQCGSGAQAYTTTVTVGIRDAYTGPSLQEQAIEQTKGKTGEEYLSALLAAPAQGIFKIEFMRQNKDGELNDTPNGKPAFEAFDQDGKLMTIRYFKDGLLNDRPDGTPACLSIEIDGTVSYAKHCNNGIPGKSLSDEELAAYNAKRASQTAPAVKARVKALKL